MNRLLLIAILLPLVILSLASALWAQGGLPDMPHPAVATDERSTLNREPVGAVENTRVMQERQAEMGAEITNLADQMRGLKGDLEEIRRNSEQLRNERRDIQAALNDLSERIRKLESAAGSAGLKPPLKNGQGEETPVKPSGAMKEGKPDPKVSYAEAYKVFKDGRYGESRGKFQAFIKQFPDITLANNAQFWIGESYYAEGNVEKAILEYEKVIKNYPKGDMVPHAILKQGLGLLKIGDRTGAKIVLKKLVDEYPETHQGRIAKTKLGTLK